MKIYGRNAVEEALRSGATVERILVKKGANDAHASRIIREAADRGVRVIYREGAALDREVPRGANHQGFVAEVTEFEYSDTDDILALAEERGEKPFLILLDGVEDPHNLGAVMRVAECAGVHGIIIPKHRSVTVNDTVVKVSSGAAQYVRVAKVTNINDAIKYLRERGVWVYALDMDGEDLYSADISGATAFVVGGEGKGVSRLTRSLCDAVLSIPMFGKVNSLNASVATAVAVYEKVRRERAAK